MIFLRIFGKLKIITTSEIIQNAISRTWHFPHAPAVGFSIVYV